MELETVIPAFDEFSNQVNDYNFDADELDFQKRMALKVGFTSWEDYLKRVFYLRTTVIDVKGLADEMSQKAATNTKITGSIPLLIDRHRTIERPAEVNLIFDKVKKLSEKNQNKISAFENKLSQIYSHLLIDKHKGKVGVLDILTGFQADAKVQFEQLNSGLDNNLDVETFSLPNLNAAIKKVVQPNFYFPDKSRVLSLLHNELVVAKFIKANSDFEKSFEFKVKPPDCKPTMWLVDNTKLFYLLYRMNNKKEFHADGISIDKIAHQLFKFKTSKTSGSMRNNFVKTSKRFNDEDYINKKMADIKIILEKIGI